MGASERSPDTADSPPKAGEVDGPNPGCSGSALSALRLSALWQRGQSDGVSTRACVDWLLTVRCRGMTAACGMPRTPRPSVLLRPSDLAPYVVTLRSEAQCARSSSFPARPRIGGMAESGGGPVRVAWVDAARGMAILLVVLFHSAQQAVRRELADPDWLSWMEMASTLRMPLFFLVSGLFARNWIAKSWADLLHSKVAVLLWAYTLWATIRFVLLSFFPGESEETGSLFMLVQRAWWPQVGWFLYALAMYFVVAKLARRVPVFVQLSVAATLSAVWLSGFVQVGNHAWDGAPSYLLFFLIGCYFRPAVSKMADRLGPLPAIAAVALWAAAYWLLVSELSWSSVPGVLLLVSLIAVFAGIGMARVMGQSRILRFLGQRTLAIYVVHETFVTAVVFGASNVGFVLPDTFRGLSPLFLAVAGIAVGLFVQAVSNRWLPWLLNPPPWRPADTSLLRDAR